MALKYDSDNLLSSEWKGDAAVSGSSSIRTRVMRGIEWISFTTAAAIGAAGLSAAIDGWDGKFDGIPELLGFSPDSAADAADVPDDTKAVTKPAGTKLTPDELHEMQGPSDENDKWKPAGKAAPVEKAEPPAPENTQDKEEARRATLIQNQSYETARLNIDQIADPTVNVEPTPETVEEFRKALANRLEVDPSEISEETARKVLQTGGYTAENGRSFEVWQKQGTNDFFFVDNPYEHYPPASPSAPDVETFIPDKPTETEQKGYRFNGRLIGEDGNIIPSAQPEVAVVPEEQQPVMEVSDEDRERMLIDAAIIDNPPISTFAGENPHPEGSPKWVAWGKIDAFLTFYEGEMRTKVPMSDEKVMQFLERVTR